jgi:hypothetical protein
MNAEWRTAKDLAENDRSLVEDWQTPGVPTVRAGFERGNSSIQMQRINSTVMPIDYTFTATRGPNLFNDTS